MKGQMKADSYTDLKTHVTNESLTNYINYCQEAIAAEQPFDDLRSYLNGQHKINMIKGSLRASDDFNLIETLPKVEIAKRRTRSDSDLIEGAQPENHPPLGSLSSTKFLIHPIASADLVVEGYKFPTNFCGIFNQVNFKNCDFTDAKPNIGSLTIKTCTFEECSGTKNIKEETIIQSNSLAELDTFIKLKTASESFIVPSEDKLYNIYKNQTDKIFMPLSFISRIPGAPNLHNYSHNSAESIADKTRTIIEPIVNNKLVISAAGSLLSLIGCVAAEAAVKVMYDSLIVTTPLVDLLGNPSMEFMKYYVGIPKLCLYTAAVISTGIFVYNSINKLDKATAKIPALEISGDDKVPPKEKTFTSRLAELTGPLQKAYGNR
jgi:hypothetical protein